MGEKGFWLGGNHDPELSMVVRQPSRQRDLKRKGGSGAWRRVNNLVGTPQNRFCRWGQNPKEALESNRATKTGQERSNTTANEPLKYA